MLCYDKYNILHVYELMYMFHSSPKLHNMCSSAKKNRPSKHFSVMNYTLKVGFTTE